MKQARKARACAGVIIVLAAGLAGGLSGEELPGKAGFAFWAFQSQGFAEQLRISDLELVVNGKPQDIDGLFLLKRGSIVRREGQGVPPPPGGHDYFLLFQVYEFDPRLENIIDYIVKDVLTPSDSLILLTPFSTLGVLPADLQQQDRGKKALELKKKFRKDVKSGSTIYRNLIKQLRAMVLNISRSGAGGAASTDMFDVDMDNAETDLGIQVNLMRYKDTLPQLEKLRLAEQERMLGLARVLKNPQRRQTVFFIYQKEYRPEIDPRINSVIISNNSDQPSVQADLAEVFEFYKREARFDGERIRQLFADSGALFHMVFVNHQVKQITGIVMREQSEDVLRTFSAIAADTGGETVISSESDQVIRRLIEKYSTSYYIFFSPALPQLTGFKELSLKARIPDVKLACRKGFFQ